jgi:hypothetical protein
LWVPSPERRPDRAKTEPFQSVRQPASVNPLVFDLRVNHHAMEAAEEEDGGETRVVDRQRACGNAGLKQLAKMIDDDVVDESLSGGGAGPEKKDVV